MGRSIEMTLIMLIQNIVFDCSSCEIYIIIIMSLITYRCNGPKWISLLLTVFCFKFGNLCLPEQLNAEQLNTVQKGSIVMKILHTYNYGIP